MHSITYRTLWSEVIGTQHIHVHVQLYTYISKWVTRGDMCKVAFVTFFTPLRKCTACLLYMYMLCTKFGLGQSSDCPHKVRVRAQASSDCLSACPRTTSVVHVHVHWLVYPHWSMEHCESIWEWTKETFLARKEVRSKVLMQSQEEQDHDQLSVKTSLLYLS